MLKSGIASVLTLLLLISCQSHDCNCDKHIGCRTLFARENSNDSLLASQRFCSATNFGTDRALQDSTTAFTLKYASDSTHLIEVDSIVKYETVRNVKSGQIRQYTQNGYACFCQD